MEEIKNDTELVNKGRCMAEEDIINDILMSEKSLSDMYSIGVNEMSNKQLYKIILSLLNESKNTCREVYNLAFEKGWYSVSREDDTIISKTYTDYSNKLKELS